MPGQELSARILWLRQASAPQHAPRSPRPTGGGTRPSLRPEQGGGSKFLSALRHKRCRRGAPAGVRPGYEIDMDIRLNEPRNRRSGAPRLHPRNCADAAIAKERQERIIETVPRRYQDGKRAGPKELCQPRAAFGEVRRDLVAMALWGKFTLLPAVRVIRMTPTVLKNNQARPRGRSSSAGEPND